MGVLFAQATVNEGLETAFVYVDTATGSDSNPGTQTQPLKTISASIAAALKNNGLNIGTRVIIKPGIYRESLVINSNHSQKVMPMTFEAATNGTVFVSGAVPYTNWAPYAANPKIYTSAWPHAWGFCPADGGNAPPEQPIVLRREMIFVGGAAMTQTLSLSQMIYPGTFFVDETAGLVYVWPPAGTDMATADVEVATLPSVLLVQSSNGQTFDGIVFRGLTFQYANPCHNISAVNVAGTVTNVLFDTDSFVWNNGHGLYLTNPVTNATVVNSSATHNGASGFETFQAKNVLWQTLQASYNNWRGAQGAYYTWNTGGFHVFSDHGDIMSGLTITYNQTHTIHWDTDNQNIAASGIFASGNVIGVSVEKNEGPITIADSKFCNIVGAATEGGIIFRNSENTTITGTTFYNNNPSQIRLTGIAGGILVTNWETKQSYNLITQGLTFQNNIVEDLGTGESLIKDGSLEGSDWTAFQSTLLSDNNNWWDASNPTPFIVPAPALSTFDTFAQWQSLTAQDAHSNFAAPAVDPGSACAAATADQPDFWLLSDNGAVTADASGTAVFNLTLASLGGLAGTVALSVDGLAAIPGATATFRPSSLALPGASVLEFVAGPTTPAGVYTITALANAGNITRTVVLWVTIPSTAVRLSTTALDFGSQIDRTTSAPQAVKVTNEGQTAMTITSITAAFGFTEIDTCGTSLAAGATCTISVTFAPHSIISYSGTLTIRDSDITSSQQVTLSGIGLGAPVVSLTPTSLSFGDNVYRTPSASKKVTLQNVGTANLNISSLSVTDANSGDFSLTNTCPATVAINATCIINVTFIPAGAGKRTANITVNDNAVATPQKVSLAGTETAAITVSPKTLTFSSTSVGSPSAAKTVTVTNASSAAIPIAGFSFTGNDVGDFSQTNTCGTSLKGSGKCTVSVTFTPTAAGARGASLSIADADPSSPQTITLTGTGVVPTVSLTPASLAFGNQVYLQPSATQKATLKNTGSTTLTIASVSITGADSGDFTPTNTCGTSLAAGKSCTITVTFTPLGPGARSASLSVGDNGAGSPQAVSLTGTETPAITVSPASLTFPSTNAGITSAAKTVAVTNASTAAIAINGFTFTGANVGDFSQTNTCGTSLKGSGTCTVSVKFTPAEGGPRSASLSVNDSDPGSPQTVALSGQGLGPAVTLTPASLSFGNQVYLKRSASRQVTLQNSGTADLSITSVAVTGANSGDFSETNTCGTTVAANATCTITVTFRPAGPGARSASIAIADNVIGNPQTVSLSGTETPAIAVSPASLAFPSTNVGSGSAAQTVTVTNSSTTAIAMNSFTFTGANASDFQQSNTCGTKLTGSGTCTVSVTFTPGANGARAASLSIADSDPSSPQAVALTGIGLAPAVTLTPSSLSFGNQVYLTASAAQTVTLQNTGTAALTIASVTAGGANPGDFSQTNTCGASVAAGASCIVTVQFKPTGAGGRSASLLIGDSAPGSPQTIALTGTESPAIALSPGALAFPPTNVGSTSVAQTVTMTNSSTTAIAMTGFTVSGTNPGDYAQTNTCGMSLQGSGTCTVSVTFTPAGTGASSASLAAADGDPSSPQTIAITGTGLKAAVTLTPPSLSFGNQVYLLPSASQRVTLQNTGTAALAVTSVSVTGTNAGDFSQSNSCGTSVAAGAACTITVTFTPAGAGARSASISIVDNAPGSPHTVSLAGTEIPAITISPGSLAFSATDVGSTSTGTLTLTNASTAAINVSSFVLNGPNKNDFKQTNTCGTSLAGAGTCTVSVSFTPKAKGSRSTSLYITDLDPSSPQNVALTGTGN